ncbi:MAG: putative bicarbonate transporter, IctB family [Cyanobacteria bacterium]|jgi:putative inorganic carbon (HCO3(-)) transporter|nr:putative bicarbonate transporter, IctB family [Cyanobacteria bacterium GSL.Bin1]
MTIEKTSSDLSLSRWRGGSFVYRLVGLFSPWREGSYLLQWAEPLGMVIMGLVLALAPFVSSTLVGVLLIAGAGYWGILTLSERNIIGLTPIHLLVLLYWGIATVAVAFSPVKAEAFSGWVKLTLYLLWFALSARVLRLPSLRNWTIALYLLVSLVISVYGIRQEIFGVEQLATWNDPESELAEATRAYSYLGNPNLLAGYLLSAIALSLSALWVWQTWLQKGVALTALLANTYCLYATDSRGGWIAMVGLLTIYLLLLYYWYRDTLPQFWRIWLLPLVFAFFVGLILAAITFVEPLRLRVMSIFAGREDSSNNFRLTVWYAVLEMIRDRPGLGIGPGNEAFNAVYPLYQRPNYTALSAYSIYLEIIVETGLIGFSVFLGLLGTLAYHGWQKIRSLRAIGEREGFWVIGAIAAIAGMLTHGLVDTVWYRPEISTLWWLMVALVASYYPQIDSADNN